MSERGKEPRPDAGDERVAGSPAPEGAARAAEHAAGAMGNQAFGRALGAAREPHLARFGPFPAAAGPALPTIVTDAARGAWDIGGRVRGGVESAAQAAAEGAQESAGAAIDKAALTGRVVGITRDALDAWTGTSTIVGVRITGPAGFGGTLLGAPLMVFMQSRGAAPPGEEAVQAKALQGFADAFQLWCMQFQVPGIPLWPAFAAFPAPQAPPTPAIPMSLAVLAPAPLHLTLVGSDEREQEALDVVGMALRTAFDTWKLGRMVTRLLGHGSVPTFAPPYIPVGPVVGTGFATPPAV